MKLIKKLQECSTIGQADPILTKLNAGPAVKKLVETSLILANSQDPQQRNHAYSFMESAIKELENADVEDPNHPNPDKTKQGHLEHDQNEPVSPIQEEDDDDDDDDHPLHEEVLDNHNNGPRQDGSEQSTENQEPYPGTARDSTNGEKPMQDMSKTENQWNETGGMPPNGGGMPPNAGGMPPPSAGGMPPNAGAMQNAGGMPPNSGMIIPGLAPEVAQEMGMGMPQLPQMDTNQMMRQMQYTVEKTMNNYHRRYIAPIQQENKLLKETLYAQLRKQKAAIKQLSIELKETKTYNGAMKLDLDSMKQNSTAKFRETESGFETFPAYDSHGFPAIQPVPSRKQFKVNAARSEIEQMDKILNSKNNSIYS